MRLIVSGVALLLVLSSTAAAQTPDEPGTGYINGLTHATVRAFTEGGQQYVLVDAPAGETHLRMGHRPVFLVVPFSLRWGVKGGFSHEASIGIGLSWTPTKYVTASAKASFGTFLFTNRTHTRSVGLEFNIPVGRETPGGGPSRDNKFLVIGVEGFTRDAVKWAGFMKGRQWYASGRGAAVVVGIRRLSWNTSP